MDVGVNMDSFLLHIKLSNSSHLRSDMVLLFSLYFGPVVGQASRQSTRISLGSVWTLRYRLLPFS